MTGAEITNAQSRVLEQLRAPGEEWRTLYQLCKALERAPLVVRRHLDSLVAAKVVERKLSDDSLQYLWRVVPRIPLLETTPAPAAEAVTS